MFNQRHQKPRCYVPRAYPVRYWSLVAYAIGVPVFVRFDVSGLTHEQGLFNPWSVTTIVLTLATACIFLLVTALSGGKVILRKVYFCSWLWLSLLLVFAAASILEPNFVVKPKADTDLYLSFYRLGEWVLGFLLFLSVYTREPLETSADLVAGLVGKICWGWIAIVWCILPIAPSYAFSYTSDAISSGTMHSRLGGILIPPGALAVLAGIACFHALTCLNGTKRTVAFLFGCLTLSLTYVRGEEIAFVVALALYALFFARGVAKLVGILAGVLITLLVPAYWSSIMSYMARGNSTSNIATLSERTEVWDAAFKAFWQRPYLGYGFIAGVKGAMRDHWKFTHWVPPHAHNDFIQALLSGGVLAGILLVLLYVRALWDAIRMAPRGPQYVLFLFALFQLTVGSFLGPLISAQFGNLASIYLMCFVVVVDHHKRKHERESLQRPAHSGLLRGLPAYEKVGNMAGYSG